MPETNSEIDQSLNALADEMKEFHKQQKLGMFNFGEMAQTKKKARKYSSETTQDWFLFEYHEVKKVKIRSRVSSKKSKSDISGDCTLEQML